MLATGSVDVTDTSPVLIKNRWQLLSKIGQGAFGHTYSAIDLETNSAVAIKFEDIATTLSDTGTTIPNTVSPVRRQVLKLEVSILKKLQDDSAHFCEYFACGRTRLPEALFTAPVNSLGVAPRTSITRAEIMRQRSTSNIHRTSTSLKTASNETCSDGYIECNFLVMQLLGRNLSELRRMRPNQTFSISTIGMLASHMLAAIETLHIHGYIHRDCKPSNFVMGEGRHRQTCYLIDFGLARRFKSADGKLREPRSSTGFRGTARYASLQAHLGKELGQRDDLWSWFYILYEFQTGALPWRREKDKQRISDMKRMWSVADWPDEIPPVFEEIFGYLQELKSVESMPNFMHLNILVDKLIDSSDGKMTFDWDDPPNVAVDRKIHVSELAVKKPSSIEIPNFHPVPPTAPCPPSKGFLYRLRKLKLF